MRLEDPYPQRVECTLRVELHTAPDDARGALERLGEHLLGIPGDAVAEARVVNSITRERIRLTRAHGSAVADLVDALLLLQVIEASGEPRRDDFLRIWRPFLEGVAGDAPVPNPAVLRPRMPASSGPVRVLLASMRSYFRTGAYWCERTGIPRRWLLDARGGSRIRVAQYIATRLGGFRPIW